LNQQFAKEMKKLRASDGRIRKRKCKS